MPFFTPGTTFQPGGQVTAATLNALVGDAIPQDFNRDHFASGSKIVTVSVSEPTASAAGELWYDTSSLKLKYHNGSQYIAVAPAQEFLLTGQNNCAVGDVAILDESNGSSFITAGGAQGNANAVGVVKSAVANFPETASVQMSGVSTVNCDSTAVTIGDYLVTSGVTSGTATASGTVVDGVFARALTGKGTGLGTVEALLFSNLNKLPSATSTPIIVTGSQPIVTKAGTSSLVSALYTEATFDQTMAFETTAVDEIVMLTLTGLVAECVDQASRYVWRILIDSTPIDFGGTNYGDASEGAWILVPTSATTTSAQFSNMDFSGPVRVPTISSTHKFSVEVKRLSGGTAVSIVGGNSGGSASMRVWKNTIAVTS
jgi:hypothetical protein